GLRKRSAVFSGPASVETPYDSERRPDFVDRAHLVVDETEGECGRSDPAGIHVRPYPRREPWPCDPKTSSGKDHLGKAGDASLEPTLLDEECNDHIGTAARACSQHHL